MGYPDGGTPSNYIIEKVEPGIGATHAELICKRNSIILEPPQAAVIGKTEENPNYLGIYEGVTVNEIKRYLRNPNIPYKKIVTTPEGYRKKLIPVFKELGIDYHNDYFCLYDECEKITQDSDYRRNITVTDFFEYRNKAFVSATPLPTRNVLFKEHGFKWLRIVPDYDYKKEATLIISNNVNSDFMDLLKEKLGSSRCICVFYKSTEGIGKIVKDLLESGLIGESDYKVFCARKSVTKLKGNGISNCPERLEMPLAKLNFFTSRFFSALDIKIHRKADIIVLTNYREARHSMIDPFTEAVQIQGRFRNKLAEGRRFNSLTYITNIGDPVKFKNEHEIEEYVGTQFKTYLVLRERLENATSKQEKEAIIKDLDKLSFCDYLNEDKKLANNTDICKYMIDRGAKPQRVNVSVACRNGNAEMVELLLSRYEKPNEDDIAGWKKTAVLNGHCSIASLIDRVLNKIYIKFSQNDTMYYIKVVSGAIKNTLPNQYISASPKCRPTKTILQEILEELSSMGYMKYSLEYLIVLKKAIKYSLSISKIFHLDAEEKINDAINYFQPYKDGLMETDKRTPDGALLVVMN